MAENDRKDSQPERGAEPAWARNGGLRRGGKVAGDGRGKPGWAATPRSEPDKATPPAVAPADATESEPPRPRHDAPPWTVAPARNAPAAPSDDLAAERAEELEPVGDEDVEREPSEDVALRRHDTWDELLAAPSEPELPSEQSAPQDSPAGDAPPPVPQDAPVVSPPAETAGRNVTGPRSTTSEVASEPPREPVATRETPAAVPAVDRLPRTRRGPSVDAVPADRGRVLQPPHAAGPRPFSFGPQRETLGAPTIAVLAVGLLLLAWAVVLPSTGATEFRGGWTEIGDPAGLSFLAALFGGLFLGLLVLPLGATTKTVAGAVLAVLVVLFGVLHLTDDLMRYLFRGHPALRWLVLESPGALALVLVALAFPAGLVARGGNPGGLAPKVMTVLGAIAVLACYVVLKAPDGDQSVVAGLLATLSDAEAFRGDRIAAVAALLPLVALPLGVLVFLPTDRGAPTTLFGALSAVAVAGTLVILALHVAKPADWLQALPPLKTALFAAFGLLVAPILVGRLAALVERRVRSRPAARPLA